MPPRRMHPHQRVLAFVRRLRLVKTRAASRAELRLRSRVRSALGTSHKVSVCIASVLVLPNMKIALFRINYGPAAEPQAASQIARAAEAAGFESLWTGEHIVLPDPQAPPSPAAPDTPFIDSLVALSFVAAQTKTIRLGTGIIILPQRNPVVLAKELASTDVLAGGRLIFGIGVGYLKPEFEAIGAPFEHKGARSEEFLRAMIALWTMDKPEFRGRFVSFGGVNAMPRPVQKPHPEIVFGGHTREAFSRAARLARGWYGFALDLE